MAFVNNDFKNMQKELKELQLTYDDFIKKFLLEMGLRVVRRCQLRTPVKTGMLRSNWKLTDVIVMSDFAYITLYNPTEYAPFVEFGHYNRGRTGFIPGQFIAKISVEELEKEIPKRYDSALKKFLSGKNKYIK